MLLGTFVLLSLPLRPHLLPRDVCSPTYLLVYEHPTAHKVNVTYSQVFQPFRRCSFLFANLPLTAKKGTGCILGSNCGCSIW
jgi:hypothetical protein